jgi:sodium/hydrogen antiporter
MSAVDVVIIGAAVLGWALMSKRLEGSWLTPAMYFVVLGLLLGDEVLGWFDLAGIDSAVKLLAEVTLALVLFSDASTLNARLLGREAAFPSRLLGIGLPLTIVVGALAAALLFDQLTFIECLVLAILLAPTDAALGQAVVSDERLPSRLRQGLNAESGLNDGICVPLLFAAIAFAEADTARGFNGEVIVDMVTELAIAIAVGAAIGAAVGLVRNRAMRAGWVDSQWSRVIPVAAVAAAYALTLEWGGSGFIASFVAGLLYGIVVGGDTEHTLEFAEEGGQVLSAVTFLLFAIVLVGPALASLSFEVVLYALLSLTVVRMIPVALALLGTARLPTMLFAGWFGPRGLATIVFALTVVEESGLAGTSTIVDVATITVLFSVVLHGVSASPLTTRYAHWYRANPRESLEAP